MVETRFSKKPGFFVYIAAQMGRLLGGGLVETLLLKQQGFFYYTGPQMGALFPTAGNLRP